MVHNHNLLSFRRTACRFDVQARYVFTPATPFTRVLLRVSILHATVILATRFNPDHDTVILILIRCIIQRFAMPSKGMERGKWRGGRRPI